MINWNYFKQKYNEWQYKRNLKHRFNNSDYIDEAYLHLWNVGHDYEAIAKEFRQMRYKLIPGDSVTKKIIDFYDDKKYGLRFHNSLKKFEPQDLAVDRRWLVVNEGLILFAKMHLGFTEASPDYIGIGVGTADPTAADFQLGNQSLRNAIAESGSKELIGMDEHYNYLWLPSVASNNYSEAGLFYGKQAADGDVMITHNKFLPAIVHTLNNNAPAVNIIIKHRSY